MLSSAVTFRLLFIRFKHETSHEIWPPTGPVVWFRGLQTHERASVESSILLGGRHHNSE